MWILLPSNFSYKEIKVPQWTVFETGSELRAAEDLPRTPALRIIWRCNRLLVKNGKGTQLGWDLTSPRQSAHNEKKIIINHLSSACISRSTVQFICSASHTERACSAVYVNRACKLRGGQLKSPRETTTQPTEAAKSLYSWVSELCCLTFHPLSQLLH